MHSQELDWYLVMLFTAHMDRGALQGGDTHRKMYFRTNEMRHPCSCYMLHLPSSRWQCWTCAEGTCSQKLTSNTETTTPALPSKPCLPGPLQRGQPRIHHSELALIEGSAEGSGIYRRPPPRLTSDLYLFSGLALNQLPGVADLACFLPSPLKNYLC